MSTYHENVVTVGRQGTHGGAGGTAGADGTPATLGRMLAGGMAALFIAATAEPGVCILLSGSGGWRPVDLATWLSRLLVDGADQRFGAVGT